MNHLKAVVVFLTEVIFLIHSFLPYKVCAHTVIGAHTQRHTDTRNNYTKYPRELKGAGPESRRLSGKEQMGL